MSIYECASGFIAYYSIFIIFPNYKKSFLTHPNSQYNEYQVSSDPDELFRIFCLGILAHFSGRVHDSNTKIYRR